MKPKFAKELFITENGEIIKMAAVVTQDMEIIKALENQKQALEQLKEKARRRNSYNVGERTQDHFISIISVPNLASENVE